MMLQDVSTHASARDATQSESTTRADADVSTHASARDATETAACLPRYRVFQLTRPRGTRLYAGDIFSLVDGFQLTRPRGTRHVRKTGLRQQRHVSTHASARDATRRRLSTRSRCRCFNSRVREGRDSSSGLRSLFGTVSTHASARDATRW